MIYKLLAVVFLAAAWYAAIVGDPTFSIACVATSRSMYLEAKLNEIIKTREEEV